MNTAFISIIIPSFNSSSTIKKSLDSICAQTFTDYEILIVDGNSTDDTLDQINYYKNKHIFIKIISEPDKGVYDALNKGIKLAQGEWLYFLGSDDKIYELSTLENVSYHLKSTNAEVIYGNVFSTRFSGIYAGELKKNDFTQKNICHQSIFFKKSVFKKTGLFDLRYKAHADWDHNMKWFLSDKIKHEYIEMVIADYADGGFSSRMGDPLFAKIMKWKFSFFMRKELDFKKRIEIAWNEIKKAITEKRVHDFFFILFQLPKFIINA